MLVFVCTNVVFIKKPKQDIMLLYVLGSEMICIFIFLYCPMTQWGKIKKSESNDSKTDSELLETGAWKAWWQTMSQRNGRKCVC